MILTPDVSELTLATYDRGIPNKERIVLRPQMNLALGYYGITLGVHDSTVHAAIPIRDIIYWMSEVNVGPTDWVFIYTGSGTDSVTTLQGSNERALVYYWGRPSTLFNHHTVVPMLFRIGAVVVDFPPWQQPALPPNPSTARLSELLRLNQKK